MAGWVSDDGASVPRAEPLDVTWEVSSAESARKPRAMAPWLDSREKNGGWSNVQVSPLRIVGHALVEGKAVNTVTLELSADGRTLKSWVGEDATAYQISHRR